MTNLYQPLLDWLNAPMLHVWGATMSSSEIIGFVTGALCVWLVAKQHLLNWPIGIANNLMFLVLFVHAGLFADAGLQVFFAVLSLYGWWAWLYGSQEHAELHVSRTPRQTALALAIAGLCGTAALLGIMTHFTSSTVPFWDALTTTLSLVATYGQCRKQLESWWVWIAADILYVPLYAYKGLWLTAVLYVGFIALCVNGYLSWKRELRAEPELAAA